MNTFTITKNGKKRSYNVFTSGGKISNTFKKLVREGQYDLLTNTNLIYNPNTKKLLYRDQYLTKSNQLRTKFKDTLTYADNLIKDIPTAQLYSCDFIMLYMTCDTSDHRRRVAKYSKHYRQVITPNELRHSVFTSDTDILDFSRTFTEIEEHPEQFQKLVNILLTDEAFSELYYNRHLADYLTLIYCGSFAQTTPQTASSNTPTINHLITTELHLDADIKTVKYLEDENMLYPLNGKCSPYIEANFKPNSCFLTLLLEVYREPFLNRADRSKPIELTYEYLAKLFNIDTEYNQQNGYGLSIVQSIPFFKQFKLGLVVYDFNRTVIYEYAPHTFNKNISPRSLYVMVYNNHIYRLNENIISLSKKTKILQREKTLSNTFPIYKEEVEEQKEEVKEMEIKTTVRQFKKTVAEVIEYIENDKTAIDCHKIAIPLQLSLVSVILETIKRFKIVPSVSFKSNSITGMSFSRKVNDKRHRYMIGSGVDYDTYDIELTEENHELFNEQQTAIKKWLFVEQYLSQFNKDNQEYEQHFPMRPLTGALFYNDRKLKAIDMNKAYTSNLYDIDYFPVFNQFDTWDKYENQPINDYSQYIVEALGDTEEYVILLGSRFSRVYGYVLNRCKLPVIVKYVKVPSKIVPSFSKENIENLYKSALDASQKKDIINIALGQLEKKTNKRHKAKIFLNVNETYIYQLQYGGKVHRITEGDTHIYLWIKTYERELINGFLPIKEMVYSIQRLKLLQLYRKICDAGFKCYGIKTDAILVKGKVEALEAIDIKYGTTLNTFKIERGKANPTNFLQLSNNLLYEPVEIVQNWLDVPDEYNITDIPNRTLILATLPGCGKTTAILKLKEDQQKLFITSYNLLAYNLQESGDNIDAITLHKLIGNGIRLKYDENKLYDISQYKIICFDEVFLYGVRELMVIYYFIKKHPELTIYATGDPSQIEPFTDTLNNIDDIERYRAKILKLLFPNVLELKINKRMEKEEEKQQMINLQADIFNLDIPVEDTLRKYGFKIVNSIHEVDTLKNIAFFQYMRDKVNNHIHQKQIQGIETIDIGETLKIYVGLVLCCAKTQTIAGGVKVDSNAEYIIEEIGADTVSLKRKSRYDTPAFSVSHKSLAENFRYSYCSTGHSTQGATLHEKITIFNTNTTSYINRKWIWTTLTRVKRFEQIQLCFDNYGELQRKEKARFRQYLQFKIDDYKQQDKIARRPFTEANYITVENITDMLDKTDKCPICREHLEYTISNSKVNSNITLDRIDNNQPHHLNNCQLMCCSCNSAKSNKTI